MTFAAVGLALPWQIVAVYQVQLVPDSYLQNCQN